MALFAPGVLEETNRLLGDADGLLAIEELLVRARGKKPGQVIVSPRVLLISSRPPVPRLAALVIHRHAAAGVVEVGQLALGGAVVLPRGFQKPQGRFGRTFGHAIAMGKFGRIVRLGLGHSLVRRLDRPLGSQRGVLLHSLAQVICLCQTQLRFGQSFIGGLLLPLNEFGLALLHALAHSVQGREHMHRLLVVLLRRFLEPQRALGGIRLGNALAADQSQAQLELRLSIAALRQLAQAQVLHRHAIQLRTHRCQTATRHHRHQNKIPKHGADSSRASPGMTTQKAG